jgi:hypothetical protein
VLLDFLLRALTFCAHKSKPFLIQLPQGALSGEILGILVCERIPIGFGRLHSLERFFDLRDAFGVFLRACPNRRQFFLLELGAFSGKFLLASGVVCLPRVSGEKLVLGDLDFLSAYLDAKFRRFLSGFVLYIWLVVAFELGIVRIRIDIVGVRCVYINLVWLLRRVLR